MATSGKLSMTVIEAKLTRDTDFWTKMDPWVQIEMRNFKARTKTKQSAGKTPKWDETFNIDVKYIGDDMKLTVMDEDVVSHDKVAETTIKVSSLCMNGGIDEWFPVYHKGKCAGHLRLKGVWKPGVAQAAQQMMQGIGQMGMFTGQTMMAQPAMMQPMMPQQPMYGQPMMMQQPMYAQPMMQQPMMQQPMMQQPMMQQQQPMYQSQPTMMPQQQPMYQSQPTMYGQPPMQPQQPPMMQQPPQNQAQQQQYYPQMGSQVNFPERQYQPYR